MFILSDLGLEAFFSSSFSFLFFKLSSTFSFVLTVSKANVVVVSVHYRRAPEHLIPTGHEDSWCALKWVASHVGANGIEECLNEHLDFEKVFLAGDSVGATSRAIWEFGSEQKGCLG